MQEALSMMVSWQQEYSASGRLPVEWNKRSRLETYYEHAAEHLEGPTEHRRNKTGNRKSKRKTEYEKTALIARYLESNPAATSEEVGEATDINPAEVRRMWKPIKKSLEEGKRPKAFGWKTKAGDIEGYANSVECGICQTPISKSFQCELCHEIISNECKECHYTNTHREDAIP
jgi:hypothetical protein